MLFHVTLINLLSDLERKYSHEMLFLSETKSNAFEIKRIQSKLHFSLSGCLNNGRDDIILIEMLFLPIRKKRLGSRLKATVWNGSCRGE